MHAACLILIGGLLADGPRGAGDAAWRDVLFPYVPAGDIDQAGFPEPSGVAYHPARKTLFVVSDEGHVAEMSLTGEQLQRATVGGDLEGITVNPATGWLYVAVEGRETIVEVDPVDLRARREFPIERLFQGRTVMAQGGQGIEGIAFLPRPNGGSFLVANQGFGQADPQDASALYELDVPLDASGAGPAKVTRELLLGIDDMADLHYEASADHVLVVCDAPNLFLEITRGGQVVRCHALPGNDQEGVTLDAEGNLYLAQDSGGLLRFTPAPPP